MKATIDRKELKQRTLQAKRANGPRASLPALANVLLQVDDSGDTLTVTSTDLELTYIGELDSTGGDAGRCLVNAKAFDTLVGKLDGRLVTLTHDRDDDRLTLTDGDAQLTLRCGVLDDYPQLGPWPTGEALQVEAALFDKVRKAATSDEARPVLTGVLVDGPAGTLAATDGYRLHLANIDTVPWQALIPSSAIHKILQAKPGRFVTVTRSASTPGEVGVVSADGRQRWVVKLIEGSFPDYRRLWPDDHEGAATVDAGKLGKAADRIGTLALGQSNAPVSVTTDLAGRLTVEASNQEVGEASETVPADVSGETVTIAFNPKFLHECAALFDGDVTVEWRDGLKPAIFSDGGPMAALLMPMRVS